MTTAKRQAITTDIFGTVLTLNFPNGEELQLDIAKLDPRIIEQATIHGLRAKLIDAAAVSRDNNTGQSASWADKYALVKEVFDRITGENPTWNKNREGGKGYSLLVRALAIFKGKPLEDVEVFVANLTKEQKKTLQTHPEVAKIILELQVKAVKPATESIDDLLSNL